MAARLIEVVNGHVQDERAVHLPAEVAIESRVTVEVGVDDADAPQHAGPRTSRMART